jgi:hypothetical protein
VTATAPSDESAGWTRVRELSGSLGLLLADCERVTEIDRLAARAYLFDQVGEAAPKGVLAEVIQLSGHCDADLAKRFKIIRQSFSHAFLLRATTALCTRRSKSPNYVFCNRCFCMKFAPYRLRGFQMAGNASPI